jgi:hypothetical protein
MLSLLVTNYSLYSLLETVHANQLKFLIPVLPAVEALCDEITALRSDFDTKLAALNLRLDQINVKLDQISAQVTGPETGDTNVSTAIIS